MFTLSVKQRPDKRLMSKMLPPTTSTSAKNPVEVVARRASTCKQTWTSLDFAPPRCQVPHLCSKCFKKCQGWQADAQLLELTLNWLLATKVEVTNKRRQFRLPQTSQSLQVHFWPQPKLSAVRDRPQDPWDQFKLPGETARVRRPHCADDCEPDWPRLIYCPQARQDQEPRIQHQGGSRVLCCILMGDKKAEVVHSVYNWSNNHREPMARDL